jgi:hypothetical protein
MLRQVRVHTQYSPTFSLGFVWQKIPLHEERLCFDLCNKSSFCLTTCHVYDCARHDTIHCSVGSNKPSHSCICCCKVLCPVLPIHSLVYSILCTFPLLLQPRDLSSMLQPLSCLAQYTCSLILFLFYPCPCPVKYFYRPSLALSLLAWPGIGLEANAAGIGIPSFQSGTGAFGTRLGPLSPVPDWFQHQHVFYYFLHIPVLDCRRVQRLKNCTTVDSSVKVQLYSRLFYAVGTA